MVLASGIDAIAYRPGTPLAPLMAPISMLWPMLDVV